MAPNLEALFWELLKISIGTQQRFTVAPTYEEWFLLYELSIKQSLAGIMFCGFEKTIINDIDATQPLLFKWIYLQQTIINLNALQNKRAKQLYVLFKKGNYRSCVLKGQGTASYYDRPELRQSGDIDLWVDGERDEIVKYVKSLNVQIESIDIKDSTMDFFDDVTVEIHFCPNLMYNPLTNRRLQSFFSKYADIQFTSFDEKLGFAHTTVCFDLVYSLVHIYKHFFSEGIGLRQIVDYYYILKRSTFQQRRIAFITLCHLGMKSFTGGIMYILQEMLGMNSKFALCHINHRHGKFLLQEIMIGGNFGHYDTRYSIANKDMRLCRGITMFKRNLSFVKLYPSEVLWSPIWKMWHYCWRKSKGYL